MCCIRVVIKIDKISSAVLVFSIPYGGPVSMVWGVGVFSFLTQQQELMPEQWLVASIFLVCIALALAELGSAQPTCGGLYYWTHFYCSNKYRNVLSWLVGCMFYCQVPMND